MKTRFAIIALIIMGLGLAAFPDEKMAVGLFVFAYFFGSSVEDDISLLKQQVSDLESRLGQNDTNIKPDYD